MSYDIKKLMKELKNGSKGILDIMDSISNDNAGMAEIKNGIENIIGILDDMEDKIVEYTIDDSDYA